MEKQWEFDRFHEDSYGKKLIFFREVLDFRFYNY